MEVIIEQQYLKIDLLLNLKRPNRRDSNAVKLDDRWYLIGLNETQIAVPGEGLSYYLMSRHQLPGDVGGGRHIRPDLLAFPDDGLSACRPTPVCAANCGLGR